MVEQLGSLAVFLLLFGSGIVVVWSAIAYLKSRRSHE